MLLHRSTEHLVCPGKSGLISTRVKTTMNDKVLISKGKRLAYLLRHDRFYDFDEHGWREVSELIASHGFTMDELEYIVANNDKQRYEFSDDKSKIRAHQGHSVSVDFELKEATPPDKLYHGTAVRFLDSIRKNGIMKGTRLYVHLSPTKEIAEKVGARHGKPVVLVVDARKMKADGCRFYLSNNGVWLTDYVGVKYIVETL